MRVPGMFVFAPGGDLGSVNCTGQWRGHRPERSDTARSGSHSDANRHRLARSAIPEWRGLDRANCELDRRHNFNLSTVYETPQFANSVLRALGTGWRVSGIVRIVSGAQLSVTTGLGSLGIAPNSTDERVRQILGSQ